MRFRAESGKAQYPGPAIVLAKSKGKDILQLFTVAIVWGQLQKKENEDRKV